MRQIYLLIIGGRAKHGWCLSCRGGWGERCCPRGVTAIHAVAVGRTYHLLLLLSYTQTGMHVGQNFDWVRYSKIAGLSTSLMWHGSLNLVQSCKMWCAVCTLPHSHKSEPHRPINFMLAANRSTPVLWRLSWTQAFLGRSQPGGCGPNAGMKDWRAAGIGVIGSPLIDNSSTE